MAPSGLRCQIYFFNTNYPEFRLITVQKNEILELENRKMGESGQNHQPEPLLGVKSKFDAEFRRFSISTTKLSYEEFERKVLHL